MIQVQLIWEMLPQEKGAPKTVVLPVRRLALERLRSYSVIA